MQKPPSPLDSNHDYYNIVATGNNCQRKYGQCAKNWEQYGCCPPSFECQFIGSASDSGSDGDGFCQYTRGYTAC